MDKKVYIEVENLHNTKEAKIMLVNTIEELKKDWYDEDREKVIFRMDKQDYSIKDIAAATGFDESRIKEILRKHKKNI